MSEYSPGPASWRNVYGHLRQALRRRPARRPGWAVGVPVIALAAGLLFTTSATSASDVPLREDRQLQLADLIEERANRVAAAEAEVAPLEAEVAALTEALAGADAPVLAEQDRAAEHREAAGFSALRGPGLTVHLDDALRPDGVRPPGAEPDDLLVHQEDVQAVVNALWAGGAEAMTIMGERVIATSAVLCVGPVLLLHGRPYSPPYEITAIGDPAAMSDALAGSSGVQVFWEAADAYGLGYRESVEEDVSVPAYEGTSTLRSGQVPR
ncbi:DUF881 domain-containing protein [Natronosporangium hydrolyticum]|uniref:DUF881 domain-containing protein n=1 Tax=Natronosporangium hydrolyticum TaxID=2811111 RepID=A0A895YF57_9ACTN|nr:DUF881 domain-containing protein [Natronosporangium hydrolyticum]QSB14755.1 DUF881 domain-containing protein [Natronosporangium hydrolyticum]